MPKDISVRSSGIFRYYKDAKISVSLQFMELKSVNEFVLVNRAADTGERSGVVVDPGRVDDIC